MKPGIILCPADDAGRERLCDWLASNGIDPNRVPRWSRIIVTGTRIIVTEMVMEQRRRGGKRLRVERDRDGGWDAVTRKRAVRLRHELKGAK